MKKKLAYLNKDIGADDSEIIKLRWYSIDVEMSHTKMYHGTIGLLAKLTPLARSLLDHILEVMDNNNRVVNNKQLKATLKSKLKKKVMPIRV